jgi:hypothetical protein
MLEAGGGTNPIVLPPTFAPLLLTLEVLALVGTNQMFSGCLGLLRAPEAGLEPTGVVLR